MKVYQTYIFDLDGTITDTSAVWLDLFHEALLHFDVTPPERKILALHTHDWPQMLQLGLPEDSLEAFIEFARTLAKQRLHQAALHVGAYETLKSLKEQGKRLAIFSTMDREIFEPAIQQRMLDTIVAIRIAGDDVKHKKPHPAGILKALEELDVPQEEYTNAVYIGDKDTDIQAAHNAGINSVLYYPSSHQQIYDLHELKKHKPVHIITDFRELLVS